MARNYEQWTPLTAECFERDMSCEGCPNESVCILGEQYYRNAKRFYNMRHTKYAVLKTFAQYGYKGLEKYINVEALKQRRGYERD